MKIYMDPKDKREPLQFTEQWVAQSDPHFLVTVWKISERRESLEAGQPIGKLVKQFKLEAMRA